MNGQRGKRRSNGGGGHQQQAGSAAAARRRDREERFANSKWGLAPSAEALPPPPPAWRRTGCRPEPDRALPLKLLLNLATAMSKRPKNKVWGFFEVTSEIEKSAVCKLCRKEYSFKTTVGNLRKHLENKHGDQVLPETFEDELNNSFNEDCSETSVANAGDDDEEWQLDKSPKQNHEGNGRGRKRRSALWHFFKLSKEDRNKAVCNLCEAVLSYKTTISNLRIHLTNRHPNMLAELDTLPSFDPNMDQDSSENEEQSASVSCKDEYDVADYEVIQEVMLSDNMEILEPCDETNDVGGGGESNCEGDARKTLPLHGSRVKNKRSFSGIKTMPLKISRLEKKKKPDPEEQWTRSCEKFGSYVASLMLQIPRHVAANYQVQIVKRLINESVKYQENGDL